MAVDLFDLVESLKREVNVPGGDAFPDTDDVIFFGYLQDAFWEARLDGMLSGFTEDGNGSVTPTTTGADDLTRELQQLVVLYAGIRILRNELMRVQTLFRAKAGSVEYETQQSASVLKDLLGELQRRRAVVLERLSDLGVVEDYYIDAIIERDFNLSLGDHVFGPAWPGYGG